VTATVAWHSAIAGSFSWIPDAACWLADRGDELTVWAGHWWYLALVLASALLDAVVPIMPSDSALIIGGVAVATGGAPYPLWSVIALGAVGAFLGDNLSFTIGQRFAPRFERRAAGRPKFSTRLDRARRQIGERGRWLLVTTRFLPGGRAALTLACGVTRQAGWWFVRWDALAALIWAACTSVLAYLVGKPLEDRQSAALWTAFGTSVLITFVIEVVHRRHRRNHPTPLPEATAAFTPPPAP
jgi:membrane protein DedA with SNARE-associated domain